MSAFGQKRKARVIRVDYSSDEDEPKVGHGSRTPSPGRLVSDDAAKPRKTARKPFRQSGLRNSLNLDNDDGATKLNANEERSNPNAQTGKVRDEEEDEDDGPAIGRPSASLSSGSIRKSKRKPSSRLSFGVGADDYEGGDGAALQPLQPPRKHLLATGGPQPGGGLRKSVALRGLPRHFLDDDGDDNDDGRPKYSKDYLDELRSSTPSTPINLSSLLPEGDEGMLFDESELDGAVVVPSAELQAVPSHATSTKTTILTEVEIQERKERRARLAKEEGFIPFKDDDRVVLGRKEKATRLVREDEDVAEGFDEFVVDSPLALGSRASKTARKQHRAEITAMIASAEGGSDEESASESEAERRAAYEAAQARSGMDGLRKPKRRTAEDEAAAAARVPDKMASLPRLGDCLRKLTERLVGMQSELATARARVRKLEKERAEIDVREAEVQRGVNEAGERYRDGMVKLGVRGEATTGTPTRDAGAPEQRIGAEDVFTGERGLESFGNSVAANVTEVEGHDGAGDHLMMD